MNGNRSIRIAFPDTRVDRHQATVAATGSSDSTLLATARLTRMPAITAVPKSTRALMPCSHPSPATEWEKQIDDLMQQMMSSTDQTDRKRVFDQVQKIFAENLPAIYFVAPRMYMGVSSRVGSMSPTILRPQLLWSADTISVRSAPASTGSGGQ